MKGGNRIRFVPDNSLLLAFNGFQFAKSLKAGTAPLAERVLRRRAERSQRRCLRIMAAKVITDPAGVPALLTDLLDCTGIKCELFPNGLERICLCLVLGC